LQAWSPSGSLSPGGSFSSSFVDPGHEASSRGECEEVATPVEDRERKARAPRRLRGRGQKKKSEAGPECMAEEQPASCSSNTQAKKSNLRPCKAKRDRARALAEKLNKRLAEESATVAARMVGQSNSKDYLARILHAKSEESRSYSQSASSSASPSFRHDQEADEKTAGRDSVEDTCVARVVSRTKPPDGIAAVLASYRKVQNSRVQAQSDAHEGQTSPAAKEATDKTSMSLKL